MSLAGTTALRLPAAPALITTFAVDVVDKVACDTLHLTPFGRCWCHTLLAVAVCSVLAWAWKGKSVGLSWMVGHLLHLVADISFVPWLYPFVSYAWPPSPDIVATSAQLAEEFGRGLITLGDWEFSETVLQVFQWRIILLETVMLAAVLGVMHIEKHDRSQRWKAACWIVFGLSVALRIAMQLPWTKPWTLWLTA